jgi:hypothetical protein
MSQSSEFMLKIDTQKSGENPYDQKRSYYTHTLSKPKFSNKDIQKSDIKSDSNQINLRCIKSHQKRKKNLTPWFYEGKYAVPAHSHLLLLISIIFTCFYYIVILKIKRDFLIDKYYHSMCLGFVCLVDFLINREQYINKKGANLISEEFDEKSLRDSLLNKKEIDNQLNQSNLSNSQDFKFQKFQKNSKNLLSFIMFILYTILLGVLSFCSELLTFYLLNKTTFDLHFNAGLGYALLSIETIFIRFFYSVNDVKLEFINFSGLILLITFFIVNCIKYITIPLGGIAFLICTLRFAKFYIFIELATYKFLNMAKIILWVNLTDFFIGSFLTFIYLINYDKHSLFIFSDFFLVLVATLFYYLNMKFFRDFDRYGISILSFVFPMMTIFDLFINHRRVNMFELVVILILTVAVVISFIGDKIYDWRSWDDKEEQEEILD